MNANFYIYLSLFLFTRTLWIHSKGFITSRKRILIAALPLFSLLLVSLEWGAIAIACAFLTPPLLELILVHRKSSELSFSLFRQFTLIAGILAIFWAFRSNTSLALTQLAINLKQLAIAMCFPLNRCTAPIHWYSEKGDGDGYSIPDSYFKFNTPLY